MKRFERTTNEENSVKSVREIQPEEWRGFEKRIEQVRQDYKSKSAGSIKSAMDVYVMGDSNIQYNNQN